MNCVAEDFLNKYDGWYSKNKKSIDKCYKKYISQKNHFCDLFGTIRQLENMTMRDYVFQAGGRNKDALCYLIDYGTNECGTNRNNLQSGYQRYGIQLDSTGTICYPFVNGGHSRYGKNESQVFDHFKAETIKLLKYTLENNGDGIESIDMPQLHKSKLHFIYSNNQSIPIYAQNHLEKLLTMFNVDFSKNDSTFRKRQKLYGYLLSLGRLDISPWHFMQYVYSKDGYLKSKGNKAPTFNLFDGKLIYKDPDSHLFVNYENDEDIRLTGKEGEKIVYKYLKDNKASLGIAGRIKKVCEEKISSDHCDFKYKRNDGTVIYIEVKATRLNRQNEYHFIMSRQEHKFMEDHKENYHLYYVNNVFGDYNIILLKPDDFEGLLKPESFYLNAIIK